MAIHSDDLVVQDPTNSKDFLSATPGNGATLAVVSVTHGAHFDGTTQYNQGGSTQSVCLPEGRELATLAALGDRLRGIRAGDKGRTIVGDLTEFTELAKSMGLSTKVVNQLLAVFTMASTEPVAPANR